MANVHKLKSRAQSAFQEGRIPEALDQYLQANREAPGDAEIWHMLTVLHGMSGNYDEAEICCRKLIELEPNAHSAYNNLGTILKSKGKIDDAAACYRKALNIAPNYVQAINNLASALREKGERDEALMLYQEALRLKPDYAEAHNNLGALLQDLGRIQDSLQSYQRAVQLEPANAEYLFNFGCGLREAGKSEESAQLFQRILQYDPHNARAWDGLCHTQLGLRRFEDACKSGRRAIELNPGLIEAYLHTGSALQALNMTESAADMFMHALAIEPGNGMARYFLATIGADEIPDQSPADYVRELFDGYAETFDDTLVNKLEYRTPTLLHQIACNHFNTGDRKLNIIDLGCGTGLCGPLFRPVANRLVGVDLSTKMIAKARERQVYDELLVDDLTQPLVANTDSFDLVLAADVFVYIGDLRPVFTAVMAALRSGGFFIFSTERYDSGQGFVLRASGRYAHGMNYVTDLAAELEFNVFDVQSCNLRNEGSEKITGNIYVMQKS